MDTIQNGVLTFPMTYGLLAEINAETIYMLVQRSKDQFQDIRSNAFVTEEELLAQGYRKYRGKDIDVYYSLERCNHTGVCSRENEFVFDPSSRPWIMVDMAPVDEVIRVVRECPTGALKYKLKDEDEAKPE